MQTEGAAQRTPRLPLMPHQVAVKFPSETQARIWEDARRARSTASHIIRKIVMDYYDAHPETEPATQPA